MVFGQLVETAIIVICEKDDGFFNINKNKTKHNTNMDGTKYLTFAE